MIAKLERTLKVLHNKTNSIHKDPALERAVDRGTSQIPSLKFLTPGHPQVPPRDMAQAMECTFRVICVIYFICENTNTVWYNTSLKLTL